MYVYIGWDGGFNGDWYGTWDGMMGGTERDGKGWKCGATWL